MGGSRRDTCRGNRRGITLAEVRVKVFYMYRTHRCTGEGTRRGTFRGSRSGTGWGTREGTRAGADWYGYGNAV